MASTSKKTNLVVILSAVGVIALSSLVTFIFTGNLNWGDGDTKGYQNITFNDAYISCEEHTRELYENKVRTVNIDSLSSHFSESSYRYKIFLKLELYNKDRLSSTPHFVNCFVRASNGNISKFQVLEDSESGSKPQYDDGTNMFGIKRRAK